MQLSSLSNTLFDSNARKTWFKTLKNLTKYHNFGKRDGSFVKSCFKEGNLLTGDKFR